MANTPTTAQENVLDVAHPFAKKKATPTTTQQVNAWFALKPLANRATTTLTKQLVIAPTAENLPARQVSTTTILTTFALGVTKLCVKRKATITTRVTA